ELHFVQGAPDEAADEFVVDGAAHLRRPGDHVGRVRPAPAETAGATAVARARAAAAALADGAEVAEDDGAFTGAAAALARADQAEAADAVGFADLRAHQPAEDVLGVVTERRIAAEDRRQVRAVVGLEDAEDAGLGGVLLGQHLGQVGLGVVLGTLQSVQT